MLHHGIAPSIGTSVHLFLLTGRKTHLNPAKQSILDGTPNHPGMTRCFSVHSIVILDRLPIAYFSTFYQRHAFGTVRVYACKYLSVPGTFKRRGCIWLAVAHPTAKPVTNSVVRCRHYHKLPGQTWYSSRYGPPGGCLGTSFCSCDLCLSIPKIAAGFMLVRTIYAHVRQLSPLSKLRALSFSYLA